jgi:starvation-inducible DNA-binding protein
MLNTQIDLSTTGREQVGAVLNQQLADLFDLYSQTKQAHWNVAGPHFYSLHELFDRMAEDLDAYLDLIAERITTLGGLAKGTVRMAAQATRLPECALEMTEGMPVVRSLADQFGSAASTTRGAIQLAEAQGDVITADLLTEVGRGLEKNLWLLEAHLR